MNQNPEQIARDHIDTQLLACGWIIQDKKKLNLTAGLGIAVREYQTDIGPADYVLFAEKKFYDMIIDKLPWSIATIRLPWLEKQIKVNWR